VVSLPDITSSTCVGGCGQWCTRNGNMHTTVLSWCHCSQCQANEHLFITQEVAADVAVSDWTVSEHIPGSPLHTARLNQWYGTAGISTHTFTADY